MEKNDGHNLTPEQICDLENIVSAMEEEIGRVFKRFGLAPTFFLLDTEEENDYCVGSELWRLTGKANRALGDAYAAVFDLKNYLEEQKKEQ